MKMRNLYRVLLFCSLSWLIGCDIPDRTDEPLSRAQAALTAPTTIAPTSGFGDPGTTTTIDASGNVNWVGGAWYVPLGLQAGDVVGSVSVVVRDNGASNGHSSDGNNVIALLVSRTAAGDVTKGSASSTGSGLQQTLPIAPTGGSYTVQAGDEMLLETFGMKGGALPGLSTVPSMTGPVTVSPRSGPVPFSAGWRLQWNSGSPLATVHSIQAPAGVQIGLVPIFLKGSAELYVAPDYIDTGTVIMTASHGTGQDYTDRFSIGLQSPLGSGGTGDPVVTATASMVAAAARATPPVSLTVGQRFLYARIVSRFIASNGTSNQFDPSLDDAVIRAVGTFTNK